MRLIEKSNTEKIFNSLNEDFWNPGKYFQLLQDMEDIDATKWNSSTKEERDAMVLPYLKEFWNKYKEEMTDDDISALFYDLEDNNYHTEYRLLRDIIFGKDNMNESSYKDDQDFENTVKRDFRLFLMDKYGDELYDNVSNEDVNEYFTGMFYDIEDEDDLEASNKAEDIIRTTYHVSDTDDSGWDRDEEYDDGDTNWAAEEASDADERFENRYMGGGNGAGFNESIKESVLAYGMDEGEPEVLTLEQNGALVKEIGPANLFTPHYEYYDMIVPDRVKQEFAKYGNRIIEVKTGDHYPECFDEGNFEITREVPKDEYVELMKNAYVPSRGGREFGEKLKSNILAKLDEDDESYFKGVKILDNVYNNSENDALWNKSFEKLVPKTGKAKTAVGEILRCFSSLSHAYYQNGDIMSRLQYQPGYRQDAYDLSSAVNELGDKTLIDLKDKMWSTRKESAYAKYMAVFYEYFIENYLKTDNLTEAEKPKKDDKRVIMQQGNVTCIKENESYLVFENEADNEVEHDTEESAMQDFLERCGVDPNSELEEKQENK